MDALRRFLAQLRTYWGGLSTARRAALAAAGVGVFLALGAVAYLSPSSALVPVYSNLDLSEVGAMKAALTAANIKSDVVDQGTTLRVPPEKFSDAKVALAAAGLPAGGGKGYEIFDETNLMATPFVQNVNYQRALQAELGRSIGKIDGVKSARVLIARPDPSPFLRDQRPPTASVVLQLRPGTSMNRASAAGIVSLVARSVEGLKPENVTVVDSAGRLLSDPHAGDRDTMPAPQLEYREKLETYLAKKAEDVLAQHLGAGRAVVRVSADVNFQHVKERRDTYYPDEKVASSERLTTIKTTGGSSGGVVGAVSNVSRAGGALGGSKGGGGSSSQEEVIQTDYRISQSVRESVDGMGGVNRLTVAALVDLSAPADGVTPITQADAEEIVKQAVGFKSGRDDVKLTNVKLIPPGGPPEPDEELVRLQRFEGYVSLARNLSLAVAVALALLMIPLALLRRRRAASPAASASPAGDADDRRRQSLDRLSAAVRDDPEGATELFRLLIGKA
jgi:flagellar M-ring protein FliF